MGLLSLLFFAALGSFLISFLFLVVAAFRVHVGWGLGTLFIPFVNLVFAIVHWREGGKHFLAMLFSAMAMGGIVGAQIATNPRMMEAFQKGFAAGRARHYHAANGGPQDPTHAPHEVRDLAESETPDFTPPPRPAVVDPHATQRAALSRHAAELNGLYVELNKARAKLKKGSPEVASFNVKAAKYQAGITALASEQAQLDAFDHPAAAVASLALATPPPRPTGNPKEAEANAALARLRATAASADYAGFADTLKTCLADYRQTAAFPQIAATAQGTLANASPDKLTAAIQAQGTAATAEREAAMGKVRVIVNQVPPRAPTPPPGAEVYYSAFHPGALTPDYAHADLYSTRELQKGEYMYMQTVPNVFYRSADCEFNPQTKFFFTSRDVPKKKLTDAEIAEVVRLYRIIAADERMLAAQPQRLHDAQAASVELLALNKQLAASH